MDWKSLSELMQTSVAYECIVCKLYFGTERQLMEHLKTSHSRKLSVPVKTEVTKEEEYETDAYEDDEETTTDCCSDNDRQMQQRDYEHDGNAITESNNSSDMEEEENPVLSVSEQNHNPDSIHERGRSVLDVDYREAEGQGPNHSAMLREIINKGRYGFINNNGFQQFTVTELKKFVHQVSALFALYEMEQCPIEQATTTPLTLFQLSVKPSVSSASPETGNLHASKPPKLRCYNYGQSGLFATGCVKSSSSRRRRRRRESKRKRKQGVHGIQ